MLLLIYFNWILNSFKGNILFFSYLSCIFNWNELSNSFYITAYCTETSKPRIYFYWYILRIGWFAGVCYSIKQYAREKNSNNKFTWVFNANKMFSQGTVDNFLYCQLKPIFMLNSHAPKPIFVVVNFDFFYSFFFTTTRFFFIHTFILNRLIKCIGWTNSMDDGIFYVVQTTNALIIPCVRNDFFSLFVFLFLSLSVALLILIAFELISKLSDVFSF